MKLQNAAIPINAMHAASDFKVRLSALEFLVNNSPSADDWMKIEPDILDILGQDGGSNTDLQKVIELAALTPLQSVRDHIISLTENNDKQVASVARMSLARLGESRFANQLIPWVIDESIGEEVARTLAQIPLENMDVDTGQLERLTDTLDLGSSAAGNAYFWGALALGRVGRFGKLEVMMDKLRQGEYPHAFWGNPFDLENDLGAMQPLPGDFSDFLRERQESLVLSDNDPLNALFVGLNKEPAVAITEIDLLQLRSSLEDAFPGLSDHIKLPEESVVQAEQFSEVIVEVLENRISDLTSHPENSRNMPIEIALGNELMTLVQALPTHRPDAVRIARCYIDYVGKAGTRSQAFETQLGSLLSTTGSDALLDEMSELLNAKDSIEREIAWSLVSNASKSVGGGAQLYYEAGLATDGPDNALYRAAAKRELFGPLLEKSFKPSQEVGAEEPATEAPVTRSGKRSMPPGFEIPDAKPRSPEPARTTSDDPPRSAYALLQCPDKTPIGREFEVALGLSQKQIEGVVGGELQRPPKSVGAYFIRIKLLMDGFTLRGDEASEFDLPVTKDAPYPTRMLHLIPVDDPTLKPIRTLLAKFSISGQMIGAASRSIQLLDTSEQLDLGAVTPDIGATAPGIDMVVPPLESAPDMTLTITRGNTSAGDRLLWSLDSIHKAINVPPPADEVLTTDLGSKPGAFSKTMMNQVNLREGRADLKGYLEGTGAAIANQIPYWVRRKLYELSVEIVNRSPTLLIVSEEPHIPWELAFLKLGGRSEKFLAMEFVVGRWVLGEKDVETGKLVPPVPPPTEIDIRHMFIVSGDYSATKNWNRLVEAEKEAEELGKAYEATQINATLDELVEFLDSGVDGELLHFAVHGKYDPTGAKDGIALVDGSMLDPLVVASMKFKRQPLVFLNACQVGQGNAILGDYGGMAAAFLQAGAAAVIAPLWSVDDKSAKAIAQSFYCQLKTTGDPGELVRCKREDFKKNTRSGTYLAYQFFGHPKMRISLNLPEGNISHE